MLSFNYKPLALAGLLLTLNMHHTYSEINPNIIRGIAIVGAVTTTMLLTLAATKIGVYFITKKTATEQYLKNSGQIDAVIQSPLNTYNPNDLITPELLSALKTAPAPNSIKSKELIEQVETYAKEYGDPITEQTRTKQFINSLEQYTKNFELLQNIAATIQNLDNAIKRIADAHEWATKVQITNGNGQAYLESIATRKPSQTLLATGVKELLKVQDIIVESIEHITKAANVLTNKNNPLHNTLIAEIQSNLKKAAALDEATKKILVKIKTIITELRTHPEYQNHFERLMHDNQAQSQRDITLVRNNLKDSVNKLYARIEQLAPREITYHHYYY